MKFFRCLFVAFLAMTAAVTTSTFVAGCNAAQPHIDYAAEWYLEVVNEAVDNAQVQIGPGSTFLDIPHNEGESGVWIFWSDLFLLESGERRKFRMSLTGPRDSPADNQLIRWFRGIRFYAGDSDTPYRSYEYPSRGCGEDPTCWEYVDDDTLFYYYDPADGVKEYLFVESPDRPFYLERDSDDPDLGRIVITFVPNPDDDADSRMDS